MLTWQIPQGNGGSPITNYKIYRSTSAGGEILIDTIGNVTTWIDTGVASGQAYYYEVSAVSSAGEGPRSNEANATTFIVPTAPRGLVASAGNGQVVLEWQSPASNGGAAITNYTIYRGTSPGGEINLTTIGNVTTWTDTGVTNGQAYYYEASATNAVGEGFLSGEANATPLAGITSPSAPQNLQATGGNGQVALSWQAPASNGGSAIIFYKIYRGTTPGGEVLVTTIGNRTTWTDTSVRNVQAYYYETSAVNGAGEGARSNEASASPATNPTAPCSFSATAGNGQVMLAWTAPASNGGSAITGYRVYKGTTPGGETLSATIENVTTIMVVGLTNGQAYYFKVAAENGLGTGVNSTESSATPVTVPTEPRDLVARFGDQQIVIAWHPPSFDGGAVVTNYRIYRCTSPGAETLLAIVGNVTAFTDTGLASGQQLYYYAVSAVNAAGEGNRTSEAIAIGHPPDAMVNLVASSLYINSAINFTDASLDGDSPVVAWSWSFGDGSVATTRNATHAYAEPGTYLVTLVVRDANGFTNATTRSITVIAITSRQGLMSITAGLVAVLSASVVIAVKLRNKGLTRDWKEP